MKVFYIIVLSFLLSSCDSNDKQFNEKEAAVWKNRLKTANERMAISRQTDACYACEEIIGGCLCSDQDQLAFYNYTRLTKHPDIERKIYLVETDPDSQDVKSIKKFIEQNGKNALNQVFDDCKKETLEVLYQKTCPNTISNL